MSEKRDSGGNGETAQSGSVFLGVPRGLDSMKKANLVSLSYLKKSYPSMCTPFPSERDQSQTGNNAMQVCQIACHRILHRDLGLGPSVG